MIKELISSNNREDVILGILMLEESQIEDIFTERFLDHPVYDNMSNAHNIKIRTKLGGFISISRNLIYIHLDRLDNFAFGKNFIDYRNETDRLNELRRCRRIKLITG